MARGPMGTGLAALETRVRRELPKIVQAGAVNVAMERAQHDLRRENENMPRMAALDADTVRQRESLRRSATASEPLRRTDSLRESGHINVRTKSNGTVTYNIRRRGNYAAEASEAAQLRHGENLALDAMLSSRDRTSSRRKVKFSRTGRRSIPRDTVAGILRAGDRTRGVPARDYTKHPQGWHDEISRRLMAKHISVNLAGRTARVLKAAGRLTLEIVEIAAEVADG